MNEPKTGETIGVIRHFDSLGRVVIPKEFRDTLKISEKDAVEIFMTKHGFFVKKIKEGEDVE